MLYNSEQGTMSVLLRELPSRRMGDLPSSPSLLPEGEGRINFPRPLGRSEGEEENLSIYLTA